MFPIESSKSIISHTSSKNQSYSTRRQSQRISCKKIDYSIDQQIAKKRQNRIGLKYQKIDDEIKNQFINEVLKQHGTIKAAAVKFDINFSTAKAILNTYRKEGRVGKKIRRHHKNSCFLKLKKRNSTRQSITAQNQEESFIEPKQIHMTKSLEVFSKKQQPDKQIFRQQPSSSFIKKTVDSKIQNRIEEIEIKIEDSSQMKRSQNLYMIEQPTINQQNTQYMEQQQIEQYQRLLNQAILSQLFMNIYQNKCFNELGMNKQRG